MASQEILLHHGRQPNFSSKTLDIRFLNLDHTNKNKSSNCSLFNLFHRQPLNLSSYYRAAKLHQ